jgi:uncharacterized membrane protein (UPF0127 family)
MRRLILCIAVAAAGCTRSDPVQDFHSTEVILPNGHKIAAEVEIDPADLARGMMYRDSLAPDRGMLFVHGKSGKYPYWMYHCKIPLDIVWMDQNKRIVEISANTPPCRSETSSECPNYGGHEDALYVLELGGGMASKYGLAKGGQVQFF